MPAPASSLIHPVCAQLARLAVPDPVAALPGLLDVVAGVTVPRVRRGVRHRLVTVLAVSICAGDRRRPMLGRDRGMGR